MCYCTTLGSLSSWKSKISDSIRMQMENDLCDWLIRQKLCKSVTHWSTEQYTKGNLKYNAFIFCKHSKTAEQREGKDWETDREQDSMWCCLHQIQTLSDYSLSSVLQYRWEREGKRMENDKKECRMKRWPKNKESNERVHLSPSAYVPNKSNSRRSQNMKTIGADMLNKELVRDELIETHLVGREIRGLIVTPLCIDCRP